MGLFDFKILPYRDFLILSVVSAGGICSCICSMTSPVSLLSIGIIIGTLPLSIGFIFLMCLIFLLRSVPSLVFILYDRSSILLIIFPLTDQVFVSGCWTATKSFGINEMTFLSVLEEAIFLSWYSFWFCRSSATFLTCASPLTSWQLISGKLSLSFLPNNSSAGDLPQLSGVFLITSKPFKMSCFEPLHFFSILLTIFTEDSARPFDLGYFGLDVLCRNCQFFENFL